MKKTQRDIILNILLTKGGISRNTALKMFITRLGAIIKNLEYEGYKFKSFYGKEKGFTGTNRKNYYYVLLSSPKK